MAHEAKVSIDSDIAILARHRRRYIHREITRHGKTIYYFRRGKDARIRLPDPARVGDRAFNLAYQAALNGEGSYTPETPARAPNQPVLTIGRPGYVYFMRMGNSVKIGFSTDVGKRLKAIQTACPLPAKVIKIIPGSDQTERYFHHHFAAYRQSGEWFHLDGELAAFLAVTIRPVPPKEI